MPGSRVRSKAAIAVAMVSSVIGAPGIAEANFVT
jgi:hypothetical protein